MDLKSVGVFCGSSDAVDPQLLDLAHRTGTALARAGLSMVFGAGSSGLMGAAARGAISAGGTVTGVIPSDLFTNGLAAEDLTELITVPDMHERKATMYRLSDGFIALPGGLGTFEEVFEAATWTQLGLHAEPRTIVLCDEGSYWDPAMALIKGAMDERLISAGNGSILRRAHSVEQAIEILGEPPLREQPSYVLR